MFMQLSVTEKIEGQAQVDLMVHIGRSTTHFHLEDTLGKRDRDYIHGLVAWMVHTHGKDRLPPREYLEEYGSSLPVLHPTMDGTLEDFLRAIQWRIPISIGATRIPGREPWVEYTIPNLIGEKGKALKSLYPAAQA